VTTKRAQAQRAASLPPLRSFTLHGAGPFAGWEAEARADFPASVLANLQSGDIGRIMEALDSIIISHNFPDSADQLAATMAEVDPYDGAIHMAGIIFDWINKLPNR
jgi:hypothetical protein